MHLLAIIIRSFTLLVLFSANVRPRSHVQAAQDFRETESRTLGPPRVTTAPFNDQDTVDFMESRTFGPTPEIDTPSKATSVTCQNPEVPNSHVKSGSKSEYVPHDVLEFECEEGYALTGSSNITCSSRGLWEPSPPECKKSFCGPPPPLVRAVPKEEYLEKTIFPVGSKAEYVCQLGYVRFRSGQKPAICTTDFTWTLPQIQCKPKSCGNPGEVDNAQMEVDDFNFGSRVTYICDTGYVMTSKRNYRDCQADGKWSNVRPECTVLFCPPPPGIVNGHYYPEKDEYSYLDSVKYICRGELTLIGEQNIACTAEGQWSSSAPECRAVLCPSPKVDNTVELFEYRGPYKMNSIARFKCKQSYKLIGSDTVKCNQNCNWEPELPKCIGICSEVPYIPYAELVEPTTDRSFLEGTILTFKCREGYEPVADVMNTATCSGLRWSFQTFCKPLTCVKPEDVPYGRIISGSFLYENSIMYACEIGYRIKDIASRKCLADQSWSLPIPECKVQTCNAPEKIQNGWYSPIMEKYTYNHTVRYTCSKGFHLTGQSSLTCQDSGRWNNYEPVCKGTCDNPPDLPYAQLNHRFKQNTVYFRGSTVQYICKPGYFQNPWSRITIVCLSDFTWSKSETFCNRTTCGYPPKIRNAVFEATDFLFESEATYECEKGYRMVSQSNSLKCGPNRKWEGSLLVCEVQKCSPPEDLEDGSYSPNKDVYTYTESVTYKCDTLQLVGKTSAFCTEEGIWSSGAPQCRAFCTFPPDLPFAVVEEEISHQEFFDNGTSLHYACRPGFILDADKDNTLTCRNNLTWSWDNSFCPPISCGDPGAIEHGQKQSENFTFGSRVTYTCYDGYLMISKRNYRECQADGTWSGKPPVCKEPVCDQIWELQEEARQCNSNPDEWIKYLQVQHLYLQIENLKLDLEIKRQLNAPVQTSPILDKKTQWIQDD
ncbi:C4b-binding protein alpha chain-like isoform X2 [Eleutherodactylus coqui]|uniref:C4b-binding protein alpha chain-like isoform X2 n=1 Tax=Eleutherodactylus coqui TaxID=57060 RepID=UPI0034629F40